MPWKAPRRKGPREIGLSAGARRVHDLDAVTPDDLHEALVSTLQRVRVDDDDAPDEIGSLAASAEALRLTAAAPPRNQNIGSDYE